jgi:hypothetical protein
MLACTCTWQIRITPSGSLERVVDQEGETQGGAPSEGSRPIEAWYPRERCNSHQVYIKASHVQKAGTPLCNIIAVCMTKYQGRSTQLDSISQHVPSSTSMLHVCFLSISELWQGGNSVATCLAVIPVFPRHMTESTKTS